MATYRQSGVDLDAAELLITRIAPAVQGTWNDRVVGGFGGFAAGIRVPAGYRHPVLMMSTDGVGTKIELARSTNRFGGLGFDLVAMCVDDLAAAGARPLAFTDYLAVGSLQPEREQALIESIAAACRAAGCALLGGETAEHPGVMEIDAFDLAGAALGIVEEGDEITGAAIRPGDLVLGLESPNLRSNGFSLVRAALGDIDLESPFEEGHSIAEALLEPSVIYAPAVLEAVATGQVRGLAHITGGALPGNLPRVLPAGYGITIDRSSWTVPPVFRYVQEKGSITEDEMFRTFNMGIGFAAVVSPSGAEEVQAALAAHGHQSLAIGEVVTGQGVRFI
ncbi:MAG: phosphoribosylformylglycinamidine cyclo-ligase [Acidimicrobiia bacterium]|nr:phosphoribosylformylglycinamidine cyclo-ligase [Acidimicrobiia bacterium]